MGKVKGEVVDDSTPSAIMRQTSTPEIVQPCEKQSTQHGMSSRLAESVQELLQATLKMKDTESRFELAKAKFQEEMSVLKEDITRISKEIIVLQTPLPTLSRQIGSSPESEAEEMEEGSCDNDDDVSRKDSTERTDDKTVDESRALGKGNGKRAYKETNSDITQQDSKRRHVDSASSSRRSSSSFSSTGSTSNKVGTRPAQQMPQAALSLTQLSQSMMMKEREKLALLVQVIRGEIGSIKSKPPHIGHVLQELLKVQPLYLQQFPFSQFVDFIPYAQKFLELRLGLSHDKNYVNIQLGNEANPWLSQPRHLMVSYEQQLQQLPETLQDWFVTGDDIKRFRCVRKYIDFQLLINTLVALANCSKEIDDKALKQALLNQDRDFFIRYSEPSMQHYLACAMVTLKIEVKKKSSGQGVFVRLLDANQPYLPKRKNLPKKERKEKKIKPQTQVTGGPSNIPSCPKSMRRPVRPGCLLN